MTPMPEQTRRHALTDEEQRSRTRIDANTFRLQQQFMRAHGAPQRQLVTTLVEGGVFLCSSQRR